MAATDDILEDETDNSPRHVVDRSGRRDCNRKSEVKLAIFRGRDSLQAIPVKMTGALMYLAMEFGKRFMRVYVIIGATAPMRKKKVRA